MKTVEVKIYYNNEDNSINVKFDDANLILLSESKKTLNAKEIYDMFKYETGKLYKLLELDDLTGLNDDDLYYIKECHKIFENIINGISIPEEEKTDE
jgi:hypothetical protein